MNTQLNWAKTKDGWIAQNQNGRAEIFRTVQPDELPWTAEIDGTYYDKFANDARAMESVQEILDLAK